MFDLLVDIYQLTESTVNGEPEDVEGAAPLYAAVPACFVRLSGTRVFSGRRGRGTHAPPGRRDPGPWSPSAAASATCAPARARPCPPSPTTTTSSTSAGAGGDFIRNSTWRRCCDGVGPLR